MNTAIIYVFSGTGNTAKIAELYRKEFQNADVQTTVFSVRSDMSELPSPSDFDYVGFAYPVHGFNAPSIMLDLARALPAAGKSCFAFSTSGEPLRLNNSASSKMERILKRKGYRLTNEYHYVMPYNMIFRHDDGAAAKFFRTASELVPLDVEEILKGEARRLPSLPLGSLTAAVFRIEHPAMKVNGKLFRVEEQKCLHCGKCVKNCPTQNISVGDDGKFVFGTKCLMCAKCSFGCPTAAIHIGILDAWRVNGAYDFRAEESDQSGKHAGYCRKAYAEYFENAEKRISAARK